MPHLRSPTRWRNRRQPQISISVKIEPLNVDVNKQYYLVLLSHSGYLYDLYPILWSDDDFVEVKIDPSERDINKIREAEEEAEEKLIRLVSFCFINANDKEIDPLWRDFNNFYDECVEKATEHGEAILYPLTGMQIGSLEPDESDFNRICNKYIEIKLLTYDECKEIEGAGEYLGF